MQQSADVRECFLATVMQLASKQGFVLLYQVGKPFAEAKDFFSYRMFFLQGRFYELCSLTCQSNTILASLRKKFSKINGFKGTRPRASLMIFSMTLKNSKSAYYLAASILLASSRNFFAFFCRNSAVKSGSENSRSICLM